MPDIRTRKRQLLEGQLEALWQDYEAAIKQTTMALGAVDRNRAEREAEEIFKKIEKLDSELRLPESVEPVKGEPDAGHPDTGHRVGPDDRAAPGSSLDTATSQELINLLAPLMGAESERRALLTLALGSEAPLLRRLQFGGAVEPFIVNMINDLTAFGEMAPGRSALWALLEVVRDRVGVDRQARIDALRSVINVSPSPAIVEPHFDNEHRRALSEALEAA